MYLVGISMFSVFLFFLWILKDLPSVSNIDNIVFAQSSIIYDRNGEELYTLHGDENRKSVSIEKIPDSVIRATIAIEDHEFYDHQGFSVTGYTKAVLSEVLHFGEHKRGGSTLTQQFVKNTFLNSEKTYTRKIKELILALQVEYNFSKDKILEMYLNSIPYGSNAFGVEQASLTFFGKEVSNIDLGEATVLASLPKAPSFYSPYGNNVHSSIDYDSEELLALEVNTYQELLETLGESRIKLGLLPLKLELNNSSEIIIPGRTSLVLGRMYDLGFISEDKKDQTEKYLSSYEFQRNVVDIKAPHFVMYVRQLLEDKYGKEFLNAGGLRIYTTLDYNLQKKAEEIVKKQAEINEERYDATNAASLVINHQTGEILSMVGSRDYFSEAIDGNVNVIMQRRLPGSSFKPFAYAAAFQAGYSPATVVFDTETDFGDGYKPQNYDGKFRGPVSLRNALGNSLNIPAIKAGVMGGQQNTYNLAASMGVDFLKEADWYGSAIALGVAEIKPLDMAQAYSAIANLGKKVEINPFLKIIDKHGNIVDSYSAETSETLLDAETAYLVTDVLSDASSRGPGWNARLQLRSRVNAVKTGTSNKKRNDEIWPLDAWTIGYTPQVLTVAWAGNNNGTTMNRKGSGYSAAAPIWQQTMQAALEEADSIEFERPTGIKSALVSVLSGKLPSADFPKDLVKKDIFSTRNLPKTYDSSLKEIKVESLTGLSPGDNTPVEAIESAYLVNWKSVFPLNSDWQDPVREWAEEYGEEYLQNLGINNLYTRKPDKSDFYDNIDLSSKPAVKIISPIAFGEVGLSGTGVNIDVKSDNGVSKIEYFLDKTLVSTVTKSPYSVQISFPEGTKVGDTFYITVKVYDNILNTDTQSIEVKVAKDNQIPYLDFSYPSEAANLKSGDLIKIVLDTYDIRSNIKKVDLFFDNKKIDTKSKLPFDFDFAVPSSLGTHTLKAISYDSADNFNTKEIKIKIIPKKISRSFSLNFDSTINASSDLLIESYVPVEDLGEIEELILIARPKSNLDLKLDDIQLTSFDDISNSYSGNFSYLWQNVQKGNYELFLRSVYQSGKVLFSSKQALKVE